MRHFIEVTFSDGDSLRTEINGTEEEINAYYLGNFFTNSEEVARKAIKVEFLD